VAQRATKISGGFYLEGFRPQIREYLARFRVSIIEGGSINDPSSGSQLSDEITINNEGMAVMARLGQ